MPRDAIAEVPEWKAMADFGDDCYGSGDGGATAPATATLRRDGDGSRLWRLRLRLRLRLRRRLTNPATATATATAATATGDGFHFHPLAMTPENGTSADGWRMARSMTAGDGATIQQEVMNKTRIIVPRRRADRCRAEDGTRMPCLSSSRSTIRR